MRGEIAGVASSRAIAARRPVAVAGLISTFVLERVTVLMHAVARIAPLATTALRTLVAGKPSTRGRLIDADLGLTRATIFPAARLVLPRTGPTGLLPGIRTATLLLALVVVGVVGIVAFAARTERTVVADAIERAQLARLVGVRATPRLL